MSGNECVGIQQVDSQLYNAMFDSCLGFVNIDPQRVCLPHCVLHTHSRNVAAIPSAVRFILTLMPLGNFIHNNSHSLPECVMSCDERQLCI